MGSSSCSCRTQRSWTGSGPASDGHCDTQDTQDTKSRRSRNRRIISVTACHRFWTDLKGPEKKSRGEKTGLLLFLCIIQFDTKPKPLRSGQVMNKILFRYFVSLCLTSHQSQVCQNYPSNQRKFARHKFKVPFPKKS